MRGQRKSATPTRAAKSSWLSRRLRAGPRDGRRLRAYRPLISPSGHLDGEVPGAARADDQPAACVGGIRLDVARRAECHQAVEIEVRGPLGALDDVVDLEGAPTATGLALQRARRNTVRWIRQLPDVLASLVFLERTGGS